MLRQKQQKDHLTKLELAIYAALCYGAVLGVFVCIYVSAIAKTDKGKTIGAVVGFVFLAISGVFGLAIQHDVRVLDFRK
jgi:hypothetical protein